MTSERLQEVRRLVGTADESKEVVLNIHDTIKLRNICIELLNYVDELRSEYVSPYNDPAAGWE